MNNEKLKQIELIEKTVLDYMQELQAKGELTTEISTVLSNYQLHSIQSIMQS